MKLKNELSGATSPYLLQHKDNPVHWQLWGEEAFEAARNANKPILLSIGYAACHWCHVMAHESFENPQIAEVMNRLFVNIKLDREERPDIDHFYMTALQAMGEQGGWPMTMFLTPDRLPFFGGTYFPPEPRYGRVGFPEILQNIATAYHDKSAEVQEYGEKIRSHLQAAGMPKGDPDALGNALDEAVIERTVPLLRNIWDMQGGGMSGAPKFPQAPVLSLLSLIADGSSQHKEVAATMLDSTLIRMGQGGIYDHIGGGFARYSVDEHWFVPHFEKMLYDNGLLVSVYCDAWKRGGNPLFAERIHETIAWLKNDMFEGGAFCSARDADSEGKEGLYYLWTKSQVQEVLGKQAEDFCTLYNITDPGNWQEHGGDYNIPHRMGSDSVTDTVTDSGLAPLREKLLQHRAGRIPPQRDDKILCDWNGYAIIALAKAAVAFDRKDYFGLAVQAFAFITDNMQVGDGELRHCHGTEGGGLLSDYAAAILAGCELLSAAGFFDSTPPTDILTHLQNWKHRMHQHFWQADRQQFSIAADTATDLPARLSEWQDNATPSSSGLACLANAELFHLFGDVECYDIATAAMQNYGEAMRQSGFAVATMLIAYEVLHNRKQLLVTNPDDEARQELRTLSANRYRIFIANDKTAPFLTDTMQAAHAADKKGTRYRICDKGVCSPPADSLPA